MPEYGVGEGGEWPWQSHFGDVWVQVAGDGGVMLHAMDGST